MSLLPDSWAALYQAQLSRYQAAFDADHATDAKGGVLLGGILAISIFVLNKQLFLMQDKILFSMLVVGCLLFAIALTLIIIALWPRQYLLPANSTEDQPGYLTKADEDLMYQLISDAELATNSIVEHLKSKSSLFSASTVLFVVGTLLLLIVKLIGG